MDGAPSAKTGTLANKQLACGRVKVSLENTEKLRGLELRRTFWLKERWQAEGKAKLRGRICVPQCWLRKRRLRNNPRTAYVNGWEGAAREAEGGLRGRRKPGWGGLTEAKGRGSSQKEEETAL